MHATAGLAGAALLLALLARSPKGPLTPGHALLMAVEFVVYAVGFSVVCCYLVERYRRADTANISANWALASCAVWLAPILAGRASRPGLSVAAALILAVGLGRLWAGPERAAGTRSFWPCFGAAAVFEAGVAAALVNYWLPGGGLLVAGVLWVAWLAARQDETPAAPDTGLRRLALHAPAALLMTLLALLPLVRGGAGFLPWFGDTGNAREEARLVTTAAGGRSFRPVNEADVHQGVILYPELKSYTTLVAPLPALPSNLFKSGSTNPLSVPFFGVYWLYQRPAQGPPDGSFTTRGDPAETSFRSTDFRALQMEARQNMGRMIDIRCCRRIDVDIRNRDPYRNSVEMQLTLVNTQVAGRPSDAIGPVRVTDWRGAGEERLRFPLPARPVLREFDEMVVRYRLLRPRGSRSARISVERFLFVP